jgi:long-chain acyl-CoA synthetase
MKLFDAIEQNKHLLFIDETNPAGRFPVSSLQFLSLHKQEEKSLAFLYLDNSLASVTAYLSFLRSPHTIALLSPLLNESFKEKLEALYHPRFIYDTTRTSITNYIPAEGFFLRSDESNKVSIHPSIKLLLSTSGSTGSPKFVKLSEENLLSNALSITQYLPIVPTDVTPLNLPIYYSYGLSVLHSNAIQGGTIVCTNKDVLRKEFWQQLNDFGYTSFAGVPFLYEMLDRIGFTKKAYPSLRYFTQAGGKLNEVLVKKMADYAAQQKIEFFVMYGQTEATARMSYLAPQYLQTKTGSIGKAIPSGSFRVEDESGELCYRGPNVFGGYVNAPEDMASFETITELHTGDIAREDEEGFYYITGRLKRFVKLFGSRINLDEVESLIHNEMKVVMKCFGAADKFLVLAHTQDGVNAEAVKEFVSKEIKIHPSAIRTLTLSEFPLTANGKIDYTTLAKNYGA